MTNKIDYDANVLASRDLINRCEELQGEVDALIDAALDAEDREELEVVLVDLADWLGYSVIDLLDGEQCDMAPGTTFEDLVNDGLALSDEACELKLLQGVIADGESSCDDWTYGASLISDQYFTEYAQELAEDCGDLPRDRPWPLNHIDWEAAAAALQTDYSAIYIGERLYWVR